jgi:arylsulfatase A-like enzyme
MDQQIGRLLAGIQALGIDTNTLVVFTSDNGPLPTFQGARAAGLRGSKLSLYEGGVRMPFIIRWPGHIPAGRVDETTIIGGVDLLPTICAFGVARLPANASLDGENMRAAWLGECITRKQPLCWEYGRRAASFHYPRQAHDRSPQLAILKTPWKLLINADGSDAQLFNILQDRREENNVAASHPEIAQQLTKEILAWKRNLP